MANLISAVMWGGGVMIVAVCCVLSVDAITDDDVSTLSDLASKHIFSKKYETPLAETRAILSHFDDGLETGDLEKMVVELARHPQVNYPFVLAKSFYPDDKDAQIELAFSIFSEMGLKVQITFAWNSGELARVNTNIVAVAQLFSLFDTGLNGVIDHANIKKLGFQGDCGTVETMDFKGFVNCLDPKGEKKLESTSLTYRKLQEKVGEKNANRNGLVKALTKVLAETPTEELAKKQGE
jgi:hypothetical protein